MKGVAPLIKGVSFDALLADKAFDADWLLEDLDERGATAVIPPKANRKIQRASGGVCSLSVLVGLWSIGTMLSGAGGGSPNALCGLTVLEGMRHVSIRIWVFFKL